MPKTVAELEDRLNSFDRAERDQALAALLALVRDGSIELPEPRPLVNLHLHSFYSYNYLGYSPSRIVWQARREGLSVVGLVDFDLLDGIDEFFRAGNLLGIKTVAGMETRAYIPEFAGREINSPGEPGITYHMGFGFGSSRIDNPQAAAFARMLRENAQKRNRNVLKRVNAHLEPVCLDYSQDVLPLSPSGTPTERHMCGAYQAKAEQVFPDPDERSKFWAQRLDSPREQVRQIIGESRALQALIRAKTMKKGGVGYVQPTPDTFPRMTEVNSFVLSLGGIPTNTWLNGTSQGETDIEELLELEIAAGLAAVTIIPDRNWNIKDPAERQIKVRNLHRFVALADERGLPVLVGTEMNAPGQKFVDQFDTPELRPLLGCFLRGAYIMAGHTLSVLRDGRGYLSQWAAENFPDVHRKNDYFCDLGRQGLSSPGL